ncbi:MAG: DUF1566 domain-containing protein [Methylococcaceae bacterium]
MKPLKLALYFCILVHADLSFAQFCNYNIGADAPDSRYTTNANGVVIDKKTGLTWMRCALGQIWNNATCTGSGQSYHWQDALQAAENTVFAGFDDWRLPTQKELQSIIENRCNEPAINLTAFPNATSDRFWSSSFYTGYTGYAWIADFDNGYGYSGNYGESGNYAVRLVRGVANRDFLRSDKFLL